MGKYAVVIIGPAGSGKTTFCQALHEHYTASINPKASRNSVHVLNFDPATADCPYPCAFDIRDEATSDHTQSSLNLGPNGALVHCMEELLLMDKGGWFSRTFGEYEDDFVLIDMPGQIELIAQVPLIPHFIQKLKSQAHYKVVVCFLLDAQAAVGDKNKFVSACTCALSAMVAIETPFVSFLTKTDLLPRSYTSFPLSSSDDEEADIANLSVANALYRQEDGGSDQIPFQSILNCDFDALQVLPWKKKGDRLEKGDPLGRRDIFLNKLCSILSDFSLISFHAWSAVNEKIVRETSNLLDYLLEVHEDEEVLEANIPTEGELDHPAEIYG